MGDPETYPTKARATWAFVAREGYTGVSQGTVTAAGGNPERKAKPQEQRPGEPAGVTLRRR